jgi:hypothetical protein
MKVNKRQALKALQERLDIIGSDGPSRDQAIEALRICAVLAESRVLPPSVGYDLLAELLEAVWQSPINWEDRSELRSDIDDQEPAGAVRLARGLDLFLDKNERLVAITLRPSKFMEGLRLMKIVGIGHDTATDVAERHDDYLVDAYLNVGKPGSG